MVERNSMSTNTLISTEVQLLLEDLIKKLDVQNYSIDTTAATTKGDNFQGVIANAKVKGENKQGEEVTFNFIVKSAPRNGIFRATTPMSKIYDREIYVYKRVLKEFDDFQIEKKIEIPFRSYAKYYESSNDDMNEALILENMNKHGFFGVDRYQSLNYEQTKLVLKEYGKLHALSFAMRLQKPAVFNELAENAQETYLHNINTDHAYSSFCDFLEKCFSVFDPINDHLLLMKLKKWQINLREVVMKTIETDFNNPYYVIGHGDCWINNFLFKYENARLEPKGVCFLDWQFSRLGSPVLDISYFLFCCTDKEIRRKYDNLIKEYYNSLSSFLREFGEDPEEVFPLHVLKEHLKEYSIFGLFMALFVLLLNFSSPEEIPDLNQYAKDDCVIDSFKYDIKNLGQFQERVRDIIIDFFKFGYDF
ncbi:hypothetical protein FQA39_LY01318 [Lamprigera yunnana]|nr:hypothetical protein FQA39_LY01318 [Lamprigera yunnana]